MLRRFVCLTLLTLCLHAADKPLQIVKRVEPDWGPPAPGYLEEEAHVEVDVRPNSEPFFLRSSPALPPPAVLALSQWRFKGGAGGTMSISLHVPIRVKLNPMIELEQRPHWSLPAPIAQAVKLAADLNAAKAQDLLANLPHGEAPDYVRATLLTYYAKNGATNPEDTRKIRRDLILWLIHVYPQDPFLSSPYAMINAAAEPLADPEGNTQAKQAWLDALKEYPDDLAVSQNAAHFFRIADPKTAVQIVSAKPKWVRQLNWLASIYAFAALGVNAVSPTTGEPIATASPNLPDDPLSSTYRKQLLEGNDVPAVLSAMATLSDLGRNLAAHQALPAGFAGYCEALLKHTRELYPETSLTCNTAPRSQQPPLSVQRIGGKVMEANVLKKVAPEYPKKAKSERTSGNVEFTATVGPDGHVQSLDLVHGQLVFYPAAYAAVKQWEYRPTLLNGKPVTVITDIVVNFTVSQ